MDGEEHVLVMESISKHTQLELIFIIRGIINGEDLGVAANSISDG